MSTQGTAPRKRQWQQAPSYLHVQCYVTYLHVLSIYQILPRLVNTHIKGHSNVDLHFFKC